MTLDEYKYIVSLFPLTVAEAMPTTRLDRIYAHIEHPDYTYQLAWLVRYLQTTPAQKFVSCATKADARRLHHWLEKNALPAVVCDDSDLQTREMTQRYISENADCTVLTCGAPPVWLNTTACKTVIHYQLPQLLTTYLLEASAVGTIDAKIQYYTLATTAAVTTPVRDTTDRLANSHLQELKRFVDEHPNGVSFHSILNNILMSERLARMGLAHLVQHQCITTTAEKKYIPGNNAWNAAKFGIAPTTKARLDSILLETVFRASKCVSQGISIGLSEADPQPCGRCLQCLAQPSQNTPDQNILVRAMSFVKDDFVTLTPHKKWPAGVHIDKTNTIPDEYRAEEGKALCLQHDAYYGSLIGSHRETIHPELIEASVSLLRQWLRRYLEDKKTLDRVVMTTIPDATEKSARMDEYAHAIAQQLNIPFMRLLTAKETLSPQSDMPNHLMRAANAFTSFSVIPEAKGKQIILFDDIVETCWSMTTAAYLLRRAGAGTVHPYAFALTGNNLAPTE